MKIIQFILMQHAIYLAQASLASKSSPEIVPRDDLASRRKLSSTSSWSSVLAFICPPHLKHCPHHKEWQKSSTGAEEQASDGGTDSSSSTSTSFASSTSEYTTKTSSSSTSSATASDSSTSDTSEASSSSTSGTSASTSNTSSSATDDTIEDEPSTVYYKTTDDNVLEEENNATKGVENGLDFGFLYIVGAALFVGGLAMIVVQRRNRSASNIEGSKTGLIDISDDPESAFVAMEMSGANSNTAISSDIYSDINDVVVEYGVKM